jgi:hypothetical protein
MNIKIKHTFLILLILIIGVYVRLNLNELPITHPGNIKAADPFYHAIITEIIIDTHQWKYYPEYISFGVEKQINQQPPLLYINAAILSLLSNIPAWATIYFIVALVAGLRILFLYLLTLEITKNKKIATLSAIFYILPQKIDAWFYEIYIGLWIQVFSLSFLIAFAWLFFRYLNKKENWTLITLSLCITAVLLSHPQDLIFLIIPVLYLTYHLLIKEKTDIKKKIKKAAYFIFIPLINLIALSPWMLYVWKKGGYNVTWNPNPFPKEYLGGLTTPGLSFIPIALLILAILGALIVIIKWKHYKKLIGMTLLFFGITYLLPHFLVSPHYIGRARTILPIFIAPYLAIATYLIIDTLRKILNLKIKPKTIYLFLIVLILLISITPYSTLKDKIKYEHIDQEKWEAFKWIQRNLKENNTILFLEDCQQASCLYTKIRAATISQEEFIKKMNEFIETKTLPQQYKIGWASDTLWDFPAKEITKFKFEKIDKKKYLTDSMNITDFDYIYLRNLNKNIQGLNDLLIQELTKNNFKIIYKKGSIIILKNER